MLRIILRCPWPLHVVVGLIFLGLAAFALQVLTDLEAEKAQALQQGVPEAVSLNAFDPERDVHSADEVHVVGWINFDHNYQLTETRKRKVSSYDVTRRMFVLFGPDDEMGSTMARAVILLDDGAVDRFQAEAMAGFVEQRDERLVFRLNGTAERSPELYKMANDALKKEGLTKAPGFQFIEIWGPKGRDHDLQPDKDGPKIFAGVIAGIGVAFLLIAVWRFRSPYQPPVPAAQVWQASEPPKTAPKKSGRGLVVKIVLGAAVLGALWAAGLLDKLMVVLPLLIIFALYLGMRQIGRAVGSAAGRAMGLKSAPEAEVQKAPFGIGLPFGRALGQPEQKAEPVADKKAIRPDTGPVQSQTRLSERLSGLPSSPGVVKWFPFVVGLLVLFLSPKLFDGAGIGPISLTAPMATAPQAIATEAPAQTAQPITVAEPVATAAPLAAPAAPEAGAVATPAPQLAEPAMGVAGSSGWVMQLALAALVAVLAGLGWFLYQGRRKGRAIAAEPIERWEKIARQARAGRAAA